MIINNRGFTLVELIVVMAVFTVVLTLAANSFNTILSQNTKVSSSEESNIEGVIGLEMFRHDLQQTGFGLPSQYSDSGVPTYQEASESPASNFNDAPNDVPRPVVAGNNLTGGSVLDGTDYLAIKGTTLGTSKASQRWTYINYSASSLPPRQWSSENLSDGDHAIVLNRRFPGSGSEVKSELVAPAGEFDAIYSSTNLPPEFSPKIPHQVFTIYGIDDGILRMPFNRSDYYIRRTANTPARCAPKTGTLFKSVLGHHDDGKLSEIPVLECVADMQVVFGWDFGNDGQIDAYSDAAGTNVNGGQISEVQSAMQSPDDIHNKLKLIKVYILAQDGKKDRFYTNSNPDFLVGGTGENNLARTYVLSEDQKNYRWKVYRIVVVPKNL